MAIPRSLSALSVNTPLSLSIQRLASIWRYMVIANFLDGISVIRIKNGRYSVFRSPDDDGKIQYLIENTTVTVFIQKFDYGILVLFEKINGNTVI